MKDLRKFTRDGKRVGAIAEQISDDEIRVFLLYCSKGDHFVKRIVDMVHRTWKLENCPNKVEVFLETFHPKTVIVKITEGDTAEYTFKKFMNDTFYRKFRSLAHIYVSNEYLMRGDDIFVAKSVKVPKMIW